MTHRRGSRHRTQWMLLVLAASMPMPKLAHAGFDPLDPLGTLRKNAHTVSIEVAPGDWGQVDRRDLQRVLESVAHEFLDRSVGLRQDVSVRVIPRSGAPRVLYERGFHGEYRIQLTARDERWFQYAYQFAHELCHVASNFDRGVRVGTDGAHAHQWFEEALCETAALYTLKRLAATWETSPPTRNWIGYGATFAAYADALAREPHRQLTHRSLRDWYAEHAASLRDDPYLRQKNEVVASQLLPLFEQHPDYWQAIAYLNPVTARATTSFADYLAAWYEAAPDKAFPAEVMARFGFEPAARGLADARTRHGATDRPPPGETGVLGPEGD